MQRQDDDLCLLEKRSQRRARIGFIERADREWLFGITFFDPRRGDNR